MPGESCRCERYESFCGCDGSSNYHNALSQIACGWAKRRSATTSVFCYVPPYTRAV
jgi:hypothetical protein